VTLAGSKQKTQIMKLDPTRLPPFEHPGDSEKIRPASRNPIGCHQNAIGHTFSTNSGKYDLIRVNPSCSEFFRPVLPKKQPNEVKIKVN